MAKNIGTCSNCGDSQVMIVESSGKCLKCIDKDRIMKLEKDVEKIKKILKITD